MDIINDQTRVAVQTESDKQRLLDFMRGEFFKKGAISRLRAGCGQDWPPHIS
jgi:hypothetical protein